MPAKIQRQPAAPLPLDEPRYGAAWAALLYTVVVFALVYPALGGGFLVNPMSDQLNGTPYRYFSADYFRSTGSFPLWNPYILGGLPFLAANHGDAFYPTFFARMVASPDHVLTWSFAIHLFLAGFFTYRLLRAWGVGFAGSLIGGLAYMAGGQIASLVSPGHDGKMYVSALTPLVLWMIVRGMRDGRLWAWGVLALATGLCILSPHFQLTYYLGVLAASFTLYLAFRKGEGALDRKVVIRRLVYAAGAAALGFAIAAIHFLPFQEYIPFSPRGNGGRGYDYAVLFSMPPEELISAYVPQFSGILEHYWGRNSLKLHSEYLGASVILLAAAAFGSKRHGSFVRFWSIAFVVGLLWAFGGHTPFYHLVYALPMMSVVRAPGMIYFVPTLAAAVLAAIGTERLLAGAKSTRFLIIGVGIALGVALLGSAGLFTGLAHAVGGAERAEAIDANSSAVIAGVWRSFLFLALAAGVVILRLRGSLSARLAASALALVVAADLWSVDRNYFRFMAPGKEVYASDPAIDYLKSLQDPGRVAVLPVTNVERDGDPYFFGDGMMVHHVRTVTGHQANEIQRWVDLAGGKSPATPQNIFNPMFWRLANMRFLYTNGELPAEVPQLPGIRFEKRVGPVRNAAGNTVFLYEITGQNSPDAWVAPVIVKAPPSAILAGLLDPRFDPQRAALFDDTSTVQGVEVKTLPPASAVVAKTLPVQAGHITVELDRPAEQGSALVVSENFYPGWKASVDGKPVNVGRADYTLIGVPLPVGARKIELTYSERAYARGKTVTLIALALTIAWIVAGVLLDYRRRRPPTVEARA
jgi:hypothetical protein